MKVLFIQRDFLWGKSHTPKKKVFSSLLNYLKKFIFTWAKADFSFPQNNGKRLLNSMEVWNFFENENKENRKIQGISLFDKLKSS